jgi:hypothetical protein
MQRYECNKHEFISLNFYFIRKIGCYNLTSSKACDQLVHTLSKTAEAIQNHGLVNHVDLIDCYFQQIIYSMTHYKLGYKTSKER